MYMCVYIYIYIYTKCESHVPKVCFRSTSRCPSKAYSI